MKSDAISALENAGDSAVPERLKNISTTDEIRTGTGLSELTEFWAEVLSQGRWFF